MNEASEADNYALVPKQSGALERAEPGAKRILSGIVADLLAAARNQPSSVPVFSVLIAGSFVENLPSHLAMLVAQASGQPRPDVVHCERTGNLLATLGQRKFDVAFLYLPLFEPPPGHPSERLFNDERRILLWAESLNQEGHIANTGPWMVSFLRRIHEIPVVVLT